MKIFTGSANSTLIPPITGLLALTVVALLPAEAAAEKLEDGLWKTDSARISDARVAEETNEKKMITPDAWSFKDTIFEETAIEENTRIGDEEDSLSGRDVPQRPPHFIDLIKEHPVWAGLLSFTTLIALRLFFGMWILPHHKACGVMKRLFWSVIVFAPFAGPIFYGGFYKIPRTHRHGGAPVNEFAFWGERH